MNQPPFNPISDARNFFRSKSALTYLVIINISVWIFIQIFRVLAFLFDTPDSSSAFSSVVDHLAVPASFSLLIQQPWTLFTYMFLHVGIWHILFNMLWLFWFGRIFLEYLTEKQMFWVYILGGLAGAVAYITAYNVFPVFGPTILNSYTLGASASVMAIVTAIAFYVPNYTLYLLFFGRVKIIYIAIALFVLDFFTIPGGNAGGQIAHIGGALLGYLFIKSLKPSAISSYKDRSSLMGWILRMFTTRKSHSNSSRTPRRPVTDEEFNRQKAQQQKRIDTILDKISKGGYDSLTREEKEFLFKSSGKY
ncbi:MAG: rhomboid family intramembrane serine protease [Bacteroidales bacterium]|nr:rhomboid family intramembrane serine protease [Bacteroidales bacterium]